MLLIVLTLYGLLSLLHFSLQMVISHREHRRQNKSKESNPKSVFYPTVSVIVPSYNEEPEYLDDCIKSILSQDYANKIEVFVIDDGSKNQTSRLKTLYASHKKRGVKIHIFGKNLGKRHAQKIGFDKCSGEIIVTIDSDTIIEVPHGIKNLVESFNDQKVGAVTGAVAVVNNYENILTKLIELRYWSAFHQERAAQSFFGVVMCCSGPFSAYRKALIENIKEKYVSQHFLGQKCTFGDDRHLTNLILEQGYKVVFNKHAKAFTHVPNSLKRYLKQQLRWNKSFYREFFWTMHYLKKHHPFMAYDLIISAILPFLLMFALFALLYQVVSLGKMRLILNYISLLLGIASIRSFYGYYRTRNREFFIFPLYAMLHVLFLVPTRLWAIFTLRRTYWGTR